MISYRYCTGASPAPLPRPGVHSIVRRWLVDYERRTTSRVEKLTLYGVRIPVTLTKEG